MNITFSSSQGSKADSIVVGIYKDLAFTKAAEDLDKQSAGALQHAIASNYFKGEEGQTLVVNGLKDIPSKRVLLIGLGAKGAATEAGLNATGGKIATTLRATPDQSAEIRLEGLMGKDISEAQAAAFVASGILLKSWRFDKYRTKEEADQKPKLNKIVVVTSQADKATSAFEPLNHVAQGVFFTRDLMSEPANVLYPETLAKHASELKSLGVTVEILDEKKMKELGMNALLGVGQGSIRDSFLVVLQWNGGDKKNAPLAFVGKGVTFDTGGISIKPAGGMEEMKYDMGGAGAVIGLMKSLALRKAKVNAVGVIGLVENMPGGNAQRPGDVVKSMSGQTIEVLNTDAEGRLVLADALWYTQDRFKPQFIIDLATLTGAIIIALGHEYAGLFSNNDELSKRLMETGEQMDEKLCRLPLHKNYDKDINSDIADVANVQKTPRAAGSITAAQFLKRFVNDYPWAHLDICGLAWTGKDLPLCEKGPTGYGVRLLDRLVSNYYEGK
jgi:leucyl aminopeptidase